MTADPREAHAQALEHMARYRRDGRLPEGRSVAGLAEADACEAGATALRGPSDARLAALREAQGAIVAACPMCYGSGVLEGTHTGDGHESLTREPCDYCGQPVEAIRQLLAGSASVPPPETTLLQDVADLRQQFAGRIPDDILARLHCLRHCEDDYDSPGPNHDHECEQYRADPPVVLPQPEPLEHLREATRAYLAHLHSAKPLGAEFQTLKGRIITLACLVADPPVVTRRDSTKEEIHEDDQARTEWSLIEAIERELDASEPRPPGGQSVGPMASHWVMTVTTRQAMRNLLRDWKASQHT